MRDDQAGKRQDGRWVLHSISAFAPHPTPLTWSLLQRLLAAHGGFGRACELAGFTPSQTARKSGVVALREGQVYLDLKLAPRMFLPGRPTHYDPDLLSASPDAVYAPPTEPQPRYAGNWLPAGTSAPLLERLIKSYDEAFIATHVPGFRAYVRGERERDISAAGPTQWCARWQSRETETLHLFGSQVIVCAMLAGIIHHRLHAMLRREFRDEDTGVMARRLCGAGVPDRMLQADDAMHALSQNEIHPEDWIAEYGHLARDPLELASPRWREVPDALTARARTLADEPSPQAQHSERRIAARSYAKDVVARLRPRKQGALRRLLERQQRYRQLREDGRYQLLAGVGLLREMALDAGARLELGDDVFMLTREDLISAIHTGRVPAGLIAERRAEHDRYA